MRRGRGRLRRWLTELGFASRNSVRLDGIFADGYRGPGTGVKIRESNMLKDADKVNSLSAPVAISIVARGCSVSAVSSGPTTSNEIS
jgi:hypothetical protein